MLAGNLGGRVDTEKIIENLAAPTLMETSEDFDQCRLYNYLKLSEPSEVNFARTSEQSNFYILIISSSVFTVI